MNSRQSSLHACLHSGPNSSPNSSPGFSPEDGPKSKRVGRWLTGIAILIISSAAFLRYPKELRNLRVHV